MIEILSGSEVIARQVPEDEGDDFVLVNKELLPPPELFDDDGTAPYTRVVKWLYNRIPPKDRVDIEELYELIGITEYDPAAIVKFTKGRYMSDQFSIRWV